MRKPIAELFGILAAAACIFGLVLVVPPMASATPLDDQNAIISGDRLKYGADCGPLKFNPTLESIAQSLINEGISDADIAARYNGKVRQFQGVGDPQSEALTFAYQAGAGAMLSICEYTEFGSGFFRKESFLDDYDVVMIIFGKPGPAAPVDAPAGPAAPAEPAAPVALPPTPCPAGSKTATVDPPAQCEAPSNAISMEITEVGVLDANVAVTNSSALPADCAYKATKTKGLFGAKTIDRTLSVGPNSTGNITDLAFPPPGISYSATVKCTATYDGKQIPIGEATVPVDGG